VALRGRPARPRADRDLAGIAPRLGLEDGELVGISTIATQAVDRAVPSRRRDPRPRCVWRPVNRPPLERDGERLLNRLLGQVDVADGAGDGRDRPTGLQPEQAVDDVGGTFR
jgi:hypothetical protein